MFHFAAGIHHSTSYTRRTRAPKAIHPTRMGASLRVRILFVSKLLLLKIRPFTAVPLKGAISSRWQQGIASEC